MCGRFVQITPIPKLVKRFKVKRLAPIEKGPSYNVAPTQQVLMVNDEGGRQLMQARWGLVPSWGKVSSDGNHLFNARAETTRSQSELSPRPGDTALPHSRRRLLRLEERRKSQSAHVRASQLGEGLCFCGSLQHLDLSGRDYYVHLHHRDDGGEQHHKTFP